MLHDMVCCYGMPYDHTRLITSLLVFVVTMNEHVWYARDMSCLVCRLLLTNMLDCTLVLGIVLDERATRTMQT